jgi:hypothetical protein
LKGIKDVISINTDPSKPPYYTDIGAIGTTTSILDT